MSGEPRQEPESLRELVDDLAGRPPREGWIGRVQARGVDLLERATTWGPLGPAAEVCWQAFRRDQAVAGSVLASALAFRLFIWLLPLSLLLVAGLGVVSDVRSRDAGAYAEDVGLGGFFAESVGDAAETTGFTGRVILIVSGTIVLLYQTYVLLRALRAVSAFAWGVPVRPMPRPFLSTILLLALLLAGVVTGGITGFVAGLLGPLGWLVAIASLLIVPCLYVLITVTLLPTGARGWRPHVPGALGFYAMTLAIQLFNALVLFPWLTRKEETYGVLGIAAGVLVSLFVLSRAVGLSATINATLHDRRHGVSVRTAQP